MVKFKEIVESIEVIFERWRDIISIAFLFIPGLLYQIDFLDVNISNYNGLSIIPFMMLSFYYSLPFISIGVMYLLISQGKKSLSKDSFFFAGIIGVIVYFIAITRFPLSPYSGFWERYFASAIILLIISLLELSRLKYEEYRGKIK